MSELPVSISIVVPVYSGEDYLEQLSDQIGKVKHEFEEEKYPFQIVECIFVDDDSKDKSSEKLKIINEKYAWSSTITLSKNFGQHPATMAGILHSSGDWVVTLDEDLQHPPQFILDMLKVAVKSELDIIYAQPINPVHGNGFRDWSSRAFKAWIARLTKNPNVLLFNSFRLLRGNIARASSAVSIQQTYFDIALGWFSKRVGSVQLPIEDQRYTSKNQSGYSFIKLLSHAKRLIQSSELKFIRIGAVLGVLAVLFGLFISLYVVIAKYFITDFVEVRGWASTVILISVLGGLNSFLIGLVLEQISVILLHTHGKPKYFHVDRKADSALKQWFENKTKG